ncbi:dTDP-4-keto-6-deoxy-D-glucose epimerase [Actinobacteria bacterium YIM 96077]|uniref:dTDP-4-keto-6-deoxy-D-glucose epimerase n=1 Tax=Phytoactinopolyspora halophila TaxID=1981511 RepID=A0A329QPH0_9ACTN|nr:dTDP-4-dehydrorhamnose 3,5-epimerase family protein [Phytoactinopolyspora halophila]AYY12558.1 dTDP-4-keto-6-deoxy-D-glucose epimerase [Actinobacteria bacterium YIM 96077]RAW12538.1 dTDP-4-keto-6-deoxy-D-glucose epimerase [Phytoactinopolyspora halophila]
MKARELAIPGTFELVSSTFTDERGTIAIPHDERELVAVTGHPMFPVRQCTHSRSVCGVVRGVHYTATPPGSAKLVYSLWGRALDIVIDLRVGSWTFGQWDVVVLDGEWPSALFMPIGIGHAFVALEDDTTIHYMLSKRFVVEEEYAISVRDPELGLPLPTDMELILSDRDQGAPTLKQACDTGLLPNYETSRALDDALYVGHENPVTITGSTRASSA